MENTAIIMINWNGWKDSIECLESFRWPLVDAHLFLLDNHSSDESILRLREYFEERSLLYRICEPRELDLEEKAAAGQITVVLNPSNQGFAGGNNVILRYLLNAGGFRYAWLLNNDTIINSETLPQMRTWLQDHPRLAFCGSVILDYHKRGLVQCCGANYYKYLGVSKLYLKNKVWDPSTAKAIGSDDPATRYQMGASLLADLDKLQEIGLMDETFFMYSEEADWQIRARSLGYENGLAPKSIVIHKGTVSTTNRKHLFFLYYNRSALILTRKNFGFFAAVTASLSLVLVTAIRTRLRVKLFWFGLKGIALGWMAPAKKLNQEH